MFGIGTMELLVIFVVALLVIGPRKLPQMARTMGKAFGEFKRVTADVKRTIDTEVDRVERKERTVKAKSELLAEDTAAFLSAKPEPAAGTDVPKTVETAETAKGGEAAEVAKPGEAADAAKTVEAATDPTDA